MDDATNATRDAIARLLVGTAAARDAAVIIELAVNRPDPNLEKIREALVDLSDGFRALAALASTIAGGGPSIKGIAAKAVRHAFKRLGSPHELHVTEAELVTIVETAVRVAVELR